MRQGMLKITIHSHVTVLLATIFSSQSRHKLRHRQGHDDGSSVGIRKLRLQYGAGDWANQVEPCVKH